MRSLSFIAFAVCLPFLTSQAEPLQWNVLLRQWYTIGPFPVADDGEFGMATSYVDWKGALDNPDELITYNGTEFHWRKVETNTMHTPEQPARIPGIFYGAACVDSPVEQDAIMAFGAHQCVTVWQNTEQIFQLFCRNRSRMDNYKVKVRLKEGPNWFLLKTQSDVGAQRVLVRFIPPDLNKPLVAFRYVGDAVDTRPQEFPDIQLTFLGQKEEVLATHRLSGNVSIASELPFYALYAAEPKRHPAFVEIRFADQPPEIKTAQRFTWKEATAGIVDFDLAIPQKYRAAFANGQPPAAPDQMRLLASGKSIPFTIVEDGKFLEFTTPSVPVAYREFVLFAAEKKVEKFQANTLETAVLPPPTPGCTLTGRISGKDKAAIAGARIRAMENQKFLDSNAVTNAEGDFELPGLPANAAVVLLIAPPGEGPGMSAPVQIGNAASQKLEGKLDAEPAARLRGTVRQPSKSFLYTKLYITGGQGSLIEPVNPDGTFDSVVPAGNYLSAVMRGADLRPERKLIDLTVAPTLSFDFELQSGAPAILTFLGKGKEPVSNLHLNFNLRDGQFLLQWFCLADGRFVIPQAPAFTLPILAFSNLQGGQMQFSGRIDGPGEYEFVRGQPNFRQVVP